MRGFGFGFRFVGVIGCSPGEEPLGPLFVYERSQWQEVVAPLPFGDDVTTVRIGGPLESVGGGTNFANRGDVIVQFWERDEIAIEYRPFTMARHPDFAEAAMDALVVFAHRGSLTRPDDVTNDDDCLQTWGDGCHIRVWENAFNQAQRTGADLRVTLPADYGGLVDIETSDAVDDAYHRRGRICVEDLPGSLEGTTEYADVFVTLADGISVAPACSEEEREECWATGWDDSCTCLDRAGRVGVSSSLGAVNATIDVPERL